MKYRPVSSFFRGVLLSIAWGIIAANARHQYGWFNALTIISLINWIGFSADMVLEFIINIKEAPK